ncbi:hypothetical protein AU252_19725 [Pseudarthrobacter sulfonivorans]|uniref:Minor tail protein n=1 Tax=Pseudarthrobacter sulfonivorans TaxID=121292 RepID=A0A0U3FVT7_9MICC|nr:hypothetical protein [Pseudarthrobacter sulfonivorans]ALV43111.1 hypothetical protein AU252_19725 [Pseudarthrobacter sulfonivorans]
MTVNRGPGVAPIAGVGTTTTEHRLQLAGQYAENAPGVPRSGVLGQATDLLVVGRADMSYDVGPAALVISRTAAEGVYTPTLTGTTNVPTTAAPGTNSRWDLIYIKQNDQAKGDADNAAVVDVVQGTAAASPTKPTGSLPAGAYVLAEARIFATTTGTNGGSNTIAQVWRHTAARGAPIPVRNTTERDEITGKPVGLRISRLDLGGRPFWWTGTRWSTGPIGTAYVPIWTGIADFGTGGALTGTYWVDGDRVHVRSRATFGSAASLGNSIVHCPLPPGYPVSGGESKYLGSGIYIPTSGSIRHLTVFEDGGAASVWIASDPIKTPGDVPVSAAAGSYFEIAFSYQTSGIY